MNMSKDWRIETDGLDYFRNQKKTLEVADRRPVIRKASDLVGPGIGAHATRITDFNDLLATFNGYYSSDVGAAGAPNATEKFVGVVLSDSEFGGEQRFTGLTSGIEYTRIFTRSATDPESVGWGNWTGQRIPATITGYERVATWANPGALVQLLPPTFLSTVGEPGVYEPSAGGIRIRKQGIYTGHIQVGDYLGDAFGDVYPYVPNGLSLIFLGQLGVELKTTVNIPFTVIARDEHQGFSVSFVLNSSFTDGRNVWWRFACTRIGDAV